MFFPGSLLASTEDTKPDATKADIHLELKYTLTQNKHKKLKPDLVTFHDFRPGNGAGRILIAPEADTGHSSNELGELSQWL